ncbi:hypothetical protein HDU97_000705 [Phlyctochytrium planicorne]|nr:hypothetical protein HDU97_000705 [Phlyctochytrium planicorne]
MALAAMWSYLRSSPIPPESHERSHADEAQLSATSESDRILLLPIQASSETTSKQLKALSSQLRLLEAKFFNILPSETLEDMKPQIPSDLRHHGEILLMALGLKQAVLFTFPACKVPKSVLMEALSPEDDAASQFIINALKVGWLKKSSHVMVADLYAALVLYPLFYMHFQPQRRFVLDPLSHHSPTPASPATILSALRDAFPFTFRKIQSEVDSPTTETFKGAWVLWDPTDPVADKAVGRLFFRHDLWNSAQERTSPTPTSPPPQLPNQQRPNSPSGSKEPTSSPPAAFRASSPPLKSTHQPLQTWSLTEQDLATLLDYPGTLPTLDTSDPQLTEFIEIAYLDRRQIGSSTSAISPSESDSLASPTIAPSPPSGSRVREEDVPPPSRQQGSSRGVRASSTSRGGSQRSRRGRSTTPRYVAGSSVSGSGPVSTTALRDEAEHTVETSVSSVSSSCVSEDDTYYDEDDGFEADQMDDNDEDRAEIGEEGDFEATGTGDEEELVLVTTFGALKSELPKVFEHFKRYRKAARGVMDLVIWTSLEEEEK